MEETQSENTTVEEHTDANSSQTEMKQEAEKTAKPQSAQSSSVVAQVDPRAVLETMNRHKNKVAQKKRDRGPAGLYPGRRKTSVAQVRVVKGSGKITINKRPLENYFQTARYQGVVKAPLELLGQTDQLDVFVNVKGGGPTGQAEAISHGLARSLDYNFPDSHDKLRRAGFLTRDPRMVERKKYGLHKARRAPQFSKR